MNRKLTEFVFIIDSSKAMRGLEDAVTEGFNSTLRELQAAEGEALITTMLFNDRYELFHDRTELQAAAPLTERDYVVRGGTALLAGPCISSGGSGMAQRQSSVRRKCCSSLCPMAEQRNTG